MIDFDSRSFAIVLTNRVHPSRNWGSNNPARRVAAQGLALALGVRPRHGADRVVQRHDATRRPPP